jgi:hypothetical protein
MILIGILTTMGVLERKSVTGLRMRWSVATEEGCVVVRASVCAGFCSSYAKHKRHMGVMEICKFFDWEKKYLDKRNGPSKEARSA